MSLDVTGHYRARSGEVIDLQRDGRVVLAKGNAQEVLGVMTDQKDLVSLLTRQKEEPLVVWLKNPDPTPGVAPKMIFSSDRMKVTVEWPGGSRSVEFLKE